MALTQGERTFQVKKQKKKKNKKTKKKTKQKNNKKQKTKKKTKKNVKTLNRYCSHAIYVQVKGRTIWTKTPISFRMLSNNYQQMTFGFFFCLFQKLGFDILCKIVS